MMKTSELSYKAKLEVQIMKKFKFYVNCVSIPSNQVDDLIDMIDAEHQITYQTFIKNCDCLNMFKALGYCIRGNDLKIKNDFNVSFHKSKFIGNTCYYFRYSAIEHIYLNL